MCLGSLYIASITVSSAKVIIETFVSADKSAIYNKYKNGLRILFPTWYKYINAFISIERMRCKKFIEYSFQVIVCLECFQNLKSYPDI